MSAKLVKHHLERNPGDSIADLPEGVQKYLVKMGVATDKEVDNVKVNETLDKNLTALPKKKK